MVSYRRKITLNFYSIESHLQGNVSWWLNKFTFKMSYQKKTTLLLRCEQVWIQCQFGDHSDVLPATVDYVREFVTQPKTFLQFGTARINFHVGTVSALTSPASLLAHLNFPPRHGRNRISNGGAARNIADRLLKRGISIKCIPRLVDSYFISMCVCVWVLHAHACPTLMHIPGDVKIMGNWIKKADASSL